MPGEFTAITKQDLFARLAEGHAAGITVVTPNRRLAQALRADFDAYQASRNRMVWEDADILALDAFVQRGYEDALYSDDAASGGEPLPMLLSEAQQRELWVGAIEGSKWAGALLDVSRTAAHAMEAWRLAHAWGIAGALNQADANEDTRAFADWAKAYARKLKKNGLIDTALLFDVSFNAKKPKRLVGYAFDIVPVQARDLFGRFDFCECRPEKKQGKPLKTSFASPKEELEAAAAWARGRLEAGAKRIGVVVPDLDRRRREVARVFARVFGHVMGSDVPFNLSAGEPLAEYPLVSFALSLLEFTTGEIEFEQVSRILRSPFLGGAEKERGARALADVRLREQAPAALSLARLIGMLKEGPLRQRLENVFQTENQDKSPHGWARHYTALLEAAGFPGERALDSAEFQARAKFNEVLGEFARLSLVNAKFSEKKAVQELRRLCADTPFQPERAGGELRAPVQVLGLLESAGQEFDALWVSGLTDEQWPQRARPHPFLPLALQRRAQIPNASPEASLALDRQRTQDWLGAASEVVLSWARREEDRDLLPSPLIADIPEGAPEIPSFVSWREKIFRAGKTETFADEDAPPVKERSVRGGTRVLANQAACPFRAFARHRLRAEALEEPAPGPDAMERGQLLHALMANLWKLLGSSASLQNDVSPQVEQAAKSAVAGLGLQGRLAALEVARLRRLAGEWLDLERERPPFAVVAIERKVALEVAGLEMQGRIDRMDRLLEGEMRDTHAVIDYKTGARVTPKDWDGARPDDPQLPLYAIALPLPISAAAFAKLRAGDMKFAGFSAAKDAIPGVKPALDWAAMTAGWKSALEALARDFSAGRAAVDPKRGLATCRNCDLHTLCRVHERLDALGTDEEEGE